MTAHIPSPKRIKFDLQIPLVSPLRPTFAAMAGEQFQIWSETTFFNHVVKFVWLAGMFSLPLHDHIDLTTAGLKRPQLAFDTKQNEFCHISEVESDSATIGSAILSDLVPNNIRFVRETPRLHNLQTFLQKCIRTPEVKMTFLCCVRFDGQVGNISGTQRLVSMKPLVLWRDFPGPVGESPRWVNQDRREASAESIQGIHA